MTDTITRWECPECGRSSLKQYVEHSVRRGYGEWQPCPGIPVERTYVAVDQLEQAWRNGFGSALVMLRAADKMTSEVMARDKDKHGLRVMHQMVREWVDLIETLTDRCVEIGRKAGFAAVTGETCPCRDDHTSWCPTHNVDGTPK